MSEPVVSPLPLMQLSTGFWAFKTLAAAHELDLFTRLSGTPGTTAAELVEACQIQERPAEMLLTGCAALGLLEKRDGRYYNSPLAEEFLVRGKPSYFSGWVQMLDKRLYPGWGKLGEAIRTNRPTTWDPSRSWPRSPPARWSRPGSPIASGRRAGTSSPPPRCRRVTT